MAQTINIHLIDILLFRQQLLLLENKWMYSNMLNKNTQGAKEGEANQKQQLSDYTRD